MWSLVSLSNFIWERIKAIRLPKVDEKYAYIQTKGPGFSFVFLTDKLFAIALVEV